MRARRGAGRTPPWSSPDLTSKRCGIPRQDFCARNLVLAERALLRTLAFALCRPTAHAFASAYSVVGDPEAAGMGSRLAAYLVDLSLLAHGALHFAPSLLAAAAHSVAARALLAAATEDPKRLAEGSQVSDGVLEGLTRYTTAQLAAPVRLLRCVQRSTSPSSALSCSLHLRLEPS
jgi:hypothetical protein